MEARRRSYRDDRSRLPALSLGVSSVRLIVNKIETKYTCAETNTTRDIVKCDPNKDIIEYDLPVDKTTGQVMQIFIVNLGKALSTCIPSVSILNLSVVTVAAGLFAPRMFSYLLIYPFCRLVFGTLYPAYASYKAIKTKDFKEYLKWMMYWIVFAIFTSTETFTDVFLSWLPFYYEVKIMLVLWILSPITKGSSLLYRQFVHPALTRREQDIDECIAKARDQGYNTVIRLGQKGVNYATTVIMQTALRGGGGIVQQIRKSYSLSDLSECDPRNERSADEADDVLTEPRAPRQVKGRYNTRRSASEASRTMYFPEMDLDVRSNRSSRSDEPDFSHIKSTEDISSGYSSADNSASLTRTASVGAAARTRARTARTTVTAIKRPSAAEGSEGIIEELQDDDAFEYSNMPALVNVQSQLYLSHTDPPFLYHYVGNQVQVIQMLSENPLVNNNINPTVNTDCYDQSEATFEDASATIDLNSEHINKSDLPENKDQIKEAFEKHIKKNIQHLIDNEEPIETQHKSGSTNIKHDKQSTDEFQTSIKHMQVQHNENYHKINVNDTHRGLEGQNIIKGTCTDLTYHSKLNKEPNPIENFTDKENIHIALEQDAIPTTSTVVEPQEEFKSDDPTQSTVDKISSYGHTTANENIGNENAQIFRKVVKDTDDPVKGLDSGDSDDEASFGTPEESPKSKRKSPKGKYGKRKAPPPPALDKIEKAADTIMQIKENENKYYESDNNDNIFNAPHPNTSSKNSSREILLVNPITENKRRHKSKSPARISKDSSTSIGKLLQLPGKLAFWNKTDESKKSKDSIPTTVEQSRRSSTIDKDIDELHDSAAKNVYETSIAEGVQLIADDAISFQDATDLDSEVISHELMEKSDALQRLIEAKLESHPEYKLVPLYGEIPTSSKSTDV